MGDEVEIIGTGNSKYKTNTEKSDETPYKVLGSTGIIGYDSNFDYSGDFILTARVGANAGTLYTHSGNVKISDNTVFIKSYSLNFTYYLLMQFDLKKLSFGTGQPLVKASELKALKLMFPKSNTEQIYIGDLLMKIDELINLHQRKLDLLKQLKQAYLQVLFPIEGEKSPKVRFANFEEDWEQRKASEIFKSISDKGHIELPVLSASQEKGMVLRDEIGIDIKYSENSLNTYKRVLPGQFVIHLRSFQGGFAYSNIEGITSPAYTILDFIDKTKQNSLFWKVVLTSNNFIKKLETVTYGIRDGRSISYSDFSTLKFLIPHVSEQEKIGHFLLDIENTINLHTQKISDLKKIKNLYLQKLFV